MKTQEQLSKEIQAEIMRLTNGLSPQKCGDIAKDILEDKESVEMICAFLLAISYFDYIGNKDQNKKDDMFLQTATAVMGLSIRWPDIAKAFQSVAANAKRN